MIHEHHEIVNKKNLELIHKVKESFEAYTGLKVEPVFNEKTYLKIKNGGTVRALCCIKPQLRPSTLPLVIEGCGRDEPVIVITQFVSRPIAEKLRKNKIWFADAAGNVYIEVPGKLFVFVVGNPPPKIYEDKNTLKTESGAKLMLYLLTHGPEIEATYRKIAEKTGLSLGRTSHLVRALLNNGIMRKNGKTYSVIDGKRLFELWMEVYVEKLKPKRFEGVYLSKFRSNLTELYERVRKMNLPAGIGDELGGEILSLYLKARYAGLWIRLEDKELLQRELGLMRTEKGNIRVYKHFNPNVIWWSPRKGVMPVPMIIADLLETGDVRCRETARILQEKYLKWTM